MTNHASVDDIGSVSTRAEEIKAILIPLKVAVEMMIQYGYEPLKFAETVIPIIESDIKNDA